MHELFISYSQAIHKLCKSLDGHDTTARTRHDRRKSIQSRPQNQRGPWSRRCSCTSHCGAQTPTPTIKAFCIAVSDFREGWNLRGGMSGNKDTERKVGYGEKQLFPTSLLWYRHPAGTNHAYGMKWSIQPISSYCFLALPIYCIVVNI